MTQLRAAQSELAASEDRLATLAAKRDEIDSQVEAARSLVDELAAAKRAAAESHVVGELSAADLAAAQDRYRDAARALDDAGDLLAGVVGRHARARDARDAARTEYARIAARVAFLAGTRLEARAEALMGEFAGVMARRHALAKLASRLDTDARGFMSEPLAFSSPMDGLLRRPIGGGQRSEGLLGILHDHGLTDSFGAAGVPEFSESELVTLSLDGDE
jgi:hypothetical protein